MEFIGWLIIGALAGWLASIVMGTNAEQGLLMDIILGIVGALVGGFLLSLVGLGGDGGFIWSLGTAFIGAVVLLWLRRMLLSRT